MAIQPRSYSDFPTDFGHDPHMIQVFDDVARCHPLASCS
jgi:hypothetical protein